MLSSGGVHAFLPLPFHLKLDHLLRVSDDHIRWKSLLSCVPLLEYKSSRVESFPFESLPLPAPHPIPTLAPQSTTLPPWSNSSKPTARSSSHDSMGSSSSRSPCCQANFCNTEFSLAPLGGISAKKIGGGEGGVLTIVQQVAQQMY